MPGRTILVLAGDVVEDHEIMAPFLGFRSPVDPREQNRTGRDSI